MIREIWEYLRGISVLLGDVALFGLFLFVVEAILPSYSFSLATGVWILYLCILFLADHLMTAFGISMNVYLLFNTAGILAGSFLVVQGSACVPAGSSFSVYLGAAAAVTGIHGAVCGYRLPGGDRIIRYVDVLIVLIGFYLYAAFGSGREIHREAVLLGLAVMILDLMVVNRLRTGEEVHSVIRGTGIGSRMILVGLFGASLAVTTFLVGVASGQVHSAVDFFLLIMRYAGKILECFFTVVGWILAKVILLFLWFSPGVSQGTRENIAENLGFPTEELAEEGLRIPFWMLASLGVLVLIFVLVWVLYQLRYVKIRRKSELFRKKQVVRKSYFWKELLALGKRIKEQMIFEGKYRLYRNTPQGVFVFAERRGRRYGIRRKKAETPGDYIRRLALLLEEQQKESLNGDQAYREEKNKELYDLAGRLDRIFYGKPGRDEEKEMTEEACRNCRDQIFVGFALARSGKRRNDRDRKAGVNDR